jgi:predicted dehydrogenase
MRTLRRSVPSNIVNDRRIRLGVIGTGAYFKGGHLPHLKALSGEFQLRAVASRSGASAGAVARTVGAAIVTSDYHALLAERDLDAVMITTRHGSHTRIIMDALAAGKHVFVEKPMTTTIEDAALVERLARESGLVVRVGFNRRFSPYAQALRAVIGPTGPRMACIRVNIGKLPRDWSSTPSEGGRFLGEAVHFLDFLNWLIGAEPESLSSFVAGTIEVTNPNTAVQVYYPGGSVAQLLYTTQGHPSMGKEAYEVFGGQRSARMTDFRKFHSFGAPGRLANWRLKGKGQREVLEEFAAAVRGKQYAVAGADARAGLVATWMALAARESASTGKLRSFSYGEVAACAES